MKRLNKVVMLNGAFFVAPLSHPGAEAHASVEARTAAYKRLVRDFGVLHLDTLPSHGGLPGLTDDEARALVSRLTRSRVRGNTRARLRAA